MHCPFFLYCEEVFGHLDELCACVVDHGMLENRATYWHLPDWRPYPTFVPMANVEYPVTVQELSLVGFTGRWVKDVGEKCSSTLLPSLKLTPENWWLEDEFNFGMAYFQARTVSFGECKVGGSTTNYSETSFNTIWRTVPPKKQHVLRYSAVRKKGKNHGSLFGSITGFDSPSFIEYLFFNQLKREFIYLNPWFLSPLRWQWEGGISVYEMFSAKVAQPWRQNHLVFFSFFFVVQVLRSKRQKGFGTQHESVCVSKRVEQLRFICTVHPKLWFTRRFFVKPAPWDPQNIKRKIAVKWFFAMADTRIRSITPRRNLYVKSCNAAKVHGNSNENMFPWRSDMIRCGFSSLQFLGVSCIYDHILWSFFLLGIFPRQINRDRSHHLKEIRSYILSNPCTSRWFCKSQFFLHNFDARCWHENSWWKWDRCIFSDVGSSERFLLRRIRFFSYENSRRIFKWNIFSKINISFWSHGYSIDLHFILIEARWLK